MTMPDIADKDDEFSLMNGESLPAAPVCKSTPSSEKPKNNWSVELRDLDKRTDLEAPEEEICCFAQQEDRPTQRLMELLELPSFLVPPPPPSSSSSSSNDCNSGTTTWCYSCTIPTNELMDTEKIKFYLDLYQLFSMRPLIDRAHYEEGKEKATHNVYCKYTCDKGDECCWEPVFLNRNNDKRTERSMQRLVFKHSCRQQCQWGSSSPRHNNMKPQGHVLSPSLRFAIVAKFLHQRQQIQGMDDATLIKMLFNAKYNDTESVATQSCLLRRELNEELGLDVTELQWQLALQQFHNFFLRRHLRQYVDRRLVWDQRDVGKLTSWDYWRIHKGTKQVGASWFWFYTVIRTDTDSTRVQFLKRVWMCTFFPIFALVQLLVAIILFYLLLFVGSALFFIFLVCILCYSGMRGKKIEAQLKREKRRYLDEGIATLGFVSDRWLVASNENDNKGQRWVTVSYFAKDGTRSSVNLKDRRDDDLYPDDDVPILTLADRPMSGLPQRLIYSNRDLDSYLYHHVQAGITP
jgi:hypothetical protein